MLPLILRVVTFFHSFFFFFPLSNVYFNIMMVKIVRDPLSRCKLSQACYEHGVIISMFEIYWPICVNK